MNTPRRLRRLAFCALALAVTITPSSAQFITSGSVSFGPTAAGSILKREATNTYVSSSNLLIGQEHSGLDPYFLYRAYVIFDLPGFKGPLTPSDLNLSPADVGDRTSFKARVVGAQIDIPRLDLIAFPYTDLALHIRAPALTAADLTGSGVDLESAFLKLAQGPILTRNVVRYAETDGNFGISNYHIPLEAGALSFFNNRDGGQFLVSIELPFIPETRDFGDTYHLISLNNPIYLEIAVNFYEPDTSFSPVPEPSIYGAVAGTLLLGLSARRGRRRVNRRRTT